MKYVYEYYSYSTVGARPLSHPAKRKHVIMINDKVQESEWHHGTTLCSRKIHHFILTVHNRKVLNIFRYEHHRCHGSYMCVY